MTSDLSQILNTVDENFQDSIARLEAFLKIPSVSTDPAYKADCRNAATWLVEQLDALGFDASLRDTPGHPMVVAHYIVNDSTNADGKHVPHILFYGHYDVQPPEPLEAWHTPPFEPIRKTGEDGKERIFARGAADDKGQLLTFIEAVRAMINASFTDSLNMTLLFEGEEESGSPSLDEFLAENTKELSHDVALICDTNMWDAQTPAITTRLRGILHEEIVISGPDIDLHSGLYGGAAINPIRVLSRILGDLHDENGRVTIDGFYEGVTELPNELKRQWDDLSPSAGHLLTDIGLSVPSGEKGYSMLEQIWSRPTADANGIIGGYTGKGSKTVIPAKASAKLSFRLVGKQDPDKILSAFRAFVTARLPQDCQVEFLDDGHGTPALEVSLDNPALKTAAKALEAEFGKAPIMMGCGGSIPIVGAFKDVLAMDSILVGFGLGDDAIHSPNEKYDIHSFHKGIRSWVRILVALAG
jgi:acetylornithine deacetylase/succinyl-diaminopimelate desuccinylase-like protein